LVKAPRTVTTGLRAEHEGFHTTRRVILATLRLVDNKQSQRPAMAHPAPDGPATDGNKPRVERRNGMDRRRVNLGPPAGTRERRISLESRKPLVEEVSLSASDWVRFDAAVPLKPLEPPDPKR
jgi:hypothetical protein